MSGRVQSLAFKLYPISCLMMFLYIAPYGCIKSSRAEVLFASGAKLLVNLPPTIDCRKVVLICNAGPSEEDDSSENPRKGYLLTGTFDSNLNLFPFTYPRVLDRALLVKTMDYDCFIL